MIQNRRVQRIAFTVLTALFASGILPSLALAHHDMDGETPETLYQGLMSGLAHPVIGMDHMAMILLVGAYAAALRLGLLPIATFVGAGIVGCLAHLAKFDLPQAETSLAVSLVLVGLVASAALRATSLVTALVLATTGLLHGYAYGESMVGAEQGPILAYLFGLLVVQAGLASLVWLMVTKTQSTGDGRTPLAFTRALGAASVLVGVLALT
jgi:urease accessory protein